MENYKREQLNDVLKVFVLIADCMCQFGISFVAEKFCSKNRNKSEVILYFYFIQNTEMPTNNVCICHL